MPTVLLTIAAAIEGVVIAAGVTNLILAAGIAIVATTALVVGVSKAIAGALFEMPSQASFDSIAANVLVNRISNNAPIPIIYGQRRVGGTIVFLDTDVTGNQLHMNLVVAEGEIESFDAIYFNNIAFTDPKWGDAITIHEYKGTDDQQGDAYTASKFPYYSTAEHRLAGTAYLNMQFNFSPELFPSGLPVVNTLVKGIKLYDPRTQITEWSSNPALCLRDYLTNTRYGRGIDTSLIDDTSFIASANYCDELIPLAGIDKKRYACNGVADGQNNSLDIVRNILSSCRGILTFSGGLYKMIIDKPEIAEFTFSEDNIIGGWSINLGSKNSKYNRMKANFFNPDRDWQPDIALVESTEFRVQDGGALLESTVNLPFTADISRAKMILTININQSRLGIVCSFTATIEALVVEVGDVVYISHDTPGWTNKKFRIMQITLQSSDEVSIVANEYADSTYDYGVISGSDASPNTQVSDLSTCLPPTNLIITEDIVPSISELVIHVFWDKSVDFFVVGYEVSHRYKYGSSPFSDWTQTSLGSESYIEHIWVDYSTQSIALTYEIRVRAINTIGVYSEWLT